MQIECKPIPSVGNKTFVNPDDSSLSEYGDYDKNQTWDGRETNSFLVGMESQHDNRQVLLVLLKAFHFVNSVCTIFSLRKQGPPHKRRQPEELTSAVSL